MRRTPFSLVAVVIGSLSAAALSTGVIASCGTGAVGVEACRTIETARCETSKACGFSGEAVESCENFYRDQCLHGVENAGHIPEDREVATCMDAVKAAGTCATKGVKTMDLCTGAPLAENVDVDATKIAPCTIVLDAAHLLKACSWVAMPPNAGKGGGGGSGGEGESKSKGGAGGA